MLIKINGTDYSNYLLDSYDINERRDYSSWNDTKGHKHKDLTRTSIQGSLNITLSHEQLAKFQQDLESVRNDKIYTIEIYVNNLFTTKVIQAYIDYYPELRKDTSSGKLYDDISITVEEM